jgi:hypothetical protein
MAVEKVLKMGIVPLQDLYSVPVLTSTEAGELFSRAVPPPEKVYSKSTNKTRMVVSVAQSSTVLQPAVLISFPYIEVEVVSIRIAVYLKYRKERIK